MKDYILLIDHSNNPNSPVVNTVELFDTEDEANQRLIELAKKGTMSAVFCKTYEAKVTVEVKRYEKVSAPKIIEEPVVEPPVIEATGLGDLPA